MWYRLGLQLGVRPDALDVIESKYSRDTNTCKVKMFAEWLRSDANPNYETLVKALAAIGKKSLAESVCINKGRHKVPNIYPHKCTALFLNAYSIAILCFNLQVFHSQFYLLWMLLTPVSRMTEVLISNKLYSCSDLGFCEFLPDALTYLIVCKLLKSEWCTCIMYKPQNVLLAKF